MTTPLWQPSDQRIRASNLSAFLLDLGDDLALQFDSYEDLHAWSVAEPESFWMAVARFAKITVLTWGRDRLDKEDVLVDKDQMPGARWFPRARLNFAENLLRRRDSGTALIFCGEDRVRRTMRYVELYDEVSLVAQALREAGVKAGDRVAAFLPNLPETLIAMLAASSIGATWSSCSPDFGVQGVLDRFGQIEPRVLFVADGYFYNGKAHDSLARVREIRSQLPTVERVVVIPYTREAAEIDDIPGAVSLPDFVEGFSPKDIFFEQLPFDHPLYIMFSSGTTGAPKCIVHGAGGTLLKHMEEHLLQCDARPGDRVFYFTTCGWMMWNWLVSALACQSTLVLYDGSPFYPDGNRLFDLIDAERITFFGTSAKFIDAVKKAGIRPRETHKLDSVRAIASTGSPLVPESFEFVYQHIKEDLQLASISGGTDILGCFVLGNPTGPVYSGEIQCRALGMDVHVFDAEGSAVIGEAGELVCTTPFPSMPIYFWNDEDGSRYRRAYFERYENTWCHGDWVELTERGGMWIYGRSDAVLNPGGVRIGTSEIYRQVEQLEAVVEAIVVGQDWEGDTRVVLFVVLAEGRDLDEALVARIKTVIATGCTRRHVPEVVLKVDDIPRTKSGKITEIAVRDVIHGREVKNLEALANPEALDLYRGHPELA